MVAMLDFLLVGIAVALLLVLSLVIKTARSPARMRVTNSSLAVFGSRRRMQRWVRQIITPLLLLAGLAAFWWWRDGHQPQTLSGCVVKGNISLSGERIFHVPGNRYYDETIIDERFGERWFCSVQEAIAAGWRPAKG